MRTELQNEFKSRQINIWQKEKELHVQTKNTLLNLLSAMSKEELETANDMDLELEFEQGTLSSVVELSPNYVIITEYDEPCKKAIGDLSQFQQKAIIDAILLNVFKI